MQVPDAIKVFRELNLAGALNLPLPGQGKTSARHQTLCAFGRRDLSLARLIEAHTDAMAILIEAARETIANEWYGVWASDGPQSRLFAQKTDDGKWCLSGVKQYCSGAPYVTKALVTAHNNSDLMLFEVDMPTAGVSLQESAWTSSAFAVTKTLSVAFDNVVLSSRSLVGTANWYLNRTGFWHGALGPAACWAGGACGLIEAAEHLAKRDVYSLANRGALVASRWSLHAYLDTAGREIDASAAETSVEAQRRALTVRHLIERQCTDVLDRFGRATGPQLLAYDESVGRQHQELCLYIRQCHGDRDLAGIMTGADA